MTGSAMGIVSVAVVREPPSAETGDDLDRLMASGEGDCGRQIRGAEIVPVLASNLATCRIGALTANGTVPAGAIGVRCRKSGAAGQAHHEVSSQKDLRQDAERARTPSMTMAPPPIR